MSDLDKDNRLNHAEFSVAMHLVVSVSKRNLPLPAQLPAELLPGAALAPAAAAALDFAPPQAQAAPTAAASFRPLSLDDAFSGAGIGLGGDEPPPPRPAGGCRCRGLQRARALPSPARCRCNNCCS